MTTIASILRAKNQSLQPSFYTRDKNKQPIASIKRAFLKTLNVTSQQYKEGFFQYEGEQWKLILDDKNAIESDLAFEGFSNCVISFQQHDHGFYAVCRKNRQRHEQQAAKEIAQYEQDQKKVHHG
jgi:hypothetical protein